MSEITINLQAHKNFYPLIIEGKREIERTINVYMYEPDNGINENTGVLLFIAGFGGHSNSNIYKKMRKEFANKYNLITVQCDYFGYEFMQSEILKESIDNFCDMSLLQAMDNIYATIYAINYGLSKSEINSKKIIAYGHSQGGYLSHLCNAYSRIFTHICDNSSWIYPNYLKATRVLNGKIFSYLASSIFGSNCNLINTYWLYNNFNNNCYIESYHGVDDNFLAISEKEKLQTINNFNVIKILNPDNEIFFSTSHGLNADFIKNFQLFYEKIKFDKGSIFNIKDEIIFDNDNSNISISYKNIYPQIYNLKSNI